MELHQEDAHVQHAAQAPKVCPETRFVDIRPGTSPAPDPFHYSTTEDVSMANPDLEQALHK